MKASILEQILFVEAEADRLALWIPLAESDDAEDMLRRREQIAREAVRTLDLVREFADEFAALVLERRRAARAESEKKRKVA